MPVHRQINSNNKTPRAPIGSSPPGSSSQGSSSQGSSYNPNKNRRITIRGPSLQQASTSLTFNGTTIQVNSSASDLTDMARLSQAYISTNVSHDGDSAKSVNITFDGAPTPPVFNMRDTDAPLSTSQAIVNSQPDAGKAHLYCPLIKTISQS